MLSEAKSSRILERMPRYSIFVCEGIGFVGQMLGRIMNTTQSAEGYGQLVGVMSIIGQK